MSIREFVESPWEQGEDEKRSYVLTVPTSWGSNPTSTTLVVKDDGGNDVTGTVTTGSTTESGQEITTAYIQSLTANKQYRLEIKFTVDGGSILEGYGYINARV